MAIGLSVNSIISFYLEKERTKLYILDVAGTSGIKRMIRAFLLV